MTWASLAALVACASCALIAGIHDPIVNGDGGSGDGGGGDVLTVGDGGGPDGASPPWAIEDAGTTVDLYAVWGTAANDVWIVGAGGTILHSTGNGQWTPSPVQPAVNLHAVVGAGTNVYAVGGLAGQGYIFENSGSWSGPVDAGTFGELRGISAASGGAYLIAVGFAGTAIASQNGGPWGPVTCLDDGGMTPMTGADFESVWMIGGNTSTGQQGLVVGVGGAIYDMFNCKGDYTLNGTQDLFSVWMSGTASIAVGAQGAIKAFNCCFGSSGSESVPVSVDLHSVWGSSTSDLYAVGVNETILHRASGNTWTIISAPSSGPTLYAVWGSDSGNVYAVGAKGTILHGP